jgi:aromatase
VKNLDDLRELMRVSAGEDEEIDLDGDIADVPFPDLNFDSLAVLELASRIEREWGLVVSDEVAAELRTPREVLDHVNAEIGDEADLAGHNEAAVVIHAPMELVWRMTNDVESWPQLFNEYSKVEVLHREGDTIRFRLTMHPNKDGKVMSWVSERTADPVARVARAHRIETELFEYVRLRWEYREVPEGVELRWVQDFRLKPDSPVSLAQVTSRVVSNTPVQMNLIKEGVERAASGS